MPELPEVETIARGLAKRVTGDVVESVWLGQKKEPLKSPASEIAATLEHSRIASVRRMGKHIVFDLDWVALAPLRQAQGRLSPAKSRRPDRRLKGTGVASTQASSIPQAEAGAGGPPPPTKGPGTAPLGLAAALQVWEPKAEVVKHTHAILRLSSGRELRFVDPRRFGRLSVAQAGDFDATGIEPLEID